MMKTMAKYNIEIVETLSRVVDQEANSYEDAKAIVASRYLDSDIVLDWHDLEYVKYKPYPSQKLKEDFKVKITFDKNKNLLFIDDGIYCLNYTCKDATDLKILLKNYFEKNIELEPVISEKNINEKNKDYER